MTKKPYKVLKLVIDMNIIFGIILFAVGLWLLSKPVCLIVIGIVVFILSLVVSRNVGRSNQ